MATVAEVGVNLVARTGKFESGMRRAGKSLRSFRGAMLAAVGIGSVIGAARSFKTIGDGIDRIGKLSTRLGITTEALSELRLVASESGVDFEALAKGMADGARKISEAAQGKGEAKTAFEQLGLDAKELSRLAPDRQLERIADAFKAMDDNTKELELSQRIFGESGPQFLQFLNDGAAGIRKVREEARDLGSSLNDEGVRQVELFNDRIGKLATGLQSFFEKAFAGIAAMSNQALDELNRINESSFVDTIREEMAEAVELITGKPFAGRKMSGFFDFGEQHGLGFDQAKQAAEKARDFESRARKLYGDIFKQAKTPTSTGRFSETSIARSAVFGSRAGITGGKPQMVKDPALDVVIDVLRKILAKQGGATAA